MNIPEKPFDSLRLFDASIRNWLTDERVGLVIQSKAHGDNYVSVPVIMSTPELAFSTLHEMIGKGKINQYKDINPQELLNLKPEVLAGDSSLVPLPFISIWQNDMKYAMNRHQSNRWRKVVVKGQTKYMDPEKKQVVSCNYPRPYDIFYQLDIWCRYRNDLNSIKLQLIRFGHPQFTIAVDFKEPWGTQLFDIFMEGFTNTSEIEGPGIGGGNNSWNRATLDLKLEAFLIEGYDNLEKIPLEDAFASTRRVRTVQSIRIDSTMLDFESKDHGVTETVTIPEES